MLSIYKAKEIASKLHSELQGMQSAETLGEDELGRWWVGFRERYNSLFGMVGSMARLQWTSVAGDLFLPPSWMTTRCSLWSSCGWSGEADAQGR